MFSEKDKDMNFDIRIIELLKRLGKPLPTDYKSTLKSLDDSEKNAEYTSPYADEVTDSTETTDS